MEGITFNLFKVGTKEAPLFRKGRDGAPDTPAEYVGSSQDPAVQKIVGVKALAKNGQPYYKITIVRKDGDRPVYYDGALFPNDRKVEGSRQPDLTGSLDLDKESGRRLRLAAWVKTGQKAGQYLSVSGSPPQQRAAESVGAAEPEVGEDLPF